ncbi:MAG: hypothetical protein QW688_08930 [Thermoprotei archaeon]
MVNKKTPLVLALLGIAISAAVFVNFKAAQSAPADSIWVEPSTVAINAFEMPVGSKFNVTIWLNVTSQNMYTWQFKLYYNTSHLTALRAGYTGPMGAYSEWASHRTGGGTGAVSPVIEDDYVLFAESCLADYYVPAGICASLAWVEFEIIAEPPEDGTLESPLDINNVDTYILNPDLDEIQPITKLGATYTYAYVDNIPPRIGNPTQIPSTNVQPGQEVKVLVNVTDPETGVKNVTLYFTNDTTWYSIPMEFNSTSGLWEVTIPGHAQGVTIKYKIEAYDNAENCAVKDNAGAYYVYTVVPEFASPIIYILLLAFASAATVIRFRKKPKN